MTGVPPPGAVPPVAIERPALFAPTSDPAAATASVGWSVAAAALRLYPPLDDEPGGPAR